MFLESLSSAHLWSARHEGRASVLYKTYHRMLWHALGLEERSLSCVLAVIQLKRTLTDVTWMYKWYNNVFVAGVSHTVPERDIRDIDDIFRYATIMRIHVMDSESAFDIFLNPVPCRTLKSSIELSRSWCGTFK